jgi:hypothetical protein
MRQSSSTTAKVAAALLTAISPMVGAFSANAQQMVAANTPDYSACNRMHQTNPLGAIQCRVDVVKAHGVAADARGAAADDRGVKADQRIQVAKNEGGCAQEVGELRATYPSATDIARGLVKASGRPAAEYNICSLRDGIRAGLALKK